MVALIDWLKNLDPTTIAIIVGIVTLLFGKKFPQVVEFLKKILGYETVSANVNNADVGYAALKTLDIEHARRGIPPAERDKLFIEGMTRLRAEIKE